MLKILSLLLSVCLCVGSLTMSLSALADDAVENKEEVVFDLPEKVEISFSVGDETLTINGADLTVEKPYIAGDGVTLVPVRVITEAFGAKVGWDGNTRTVTVTYPDVQIVLQIGNKSVKVNRMDETLLAAPELTLNGFTMVPLRFISEKFGAVVDYDEATRLITVTKDRSNQNETVINENIEVKMVSYEELGIPTAENYSSDMIARCVWDIAYFNDKVYIGAGDYNKNMGPVPIYAYNTKTNEFELSGTVNDEEVSRFVVIDGKLTAPGIDPYWEKYGWEYGNYYSLTDSGTWELVRTIPLGIHCYDMVECDGRIFAATGTYSGKYPVSVSSDGGKSYKDVLFYKNGNLLDTSVYTTESGKNRVYDLFVLKGAVYALYSPELQTSDLYKYEDDRFVYVDTWSDKEYRTYRYMQKGLINDKTEFEGKYYFACGTFYVTDDLINLKLIEMTELYNITDVINGGDRVYALSNVRADDGNYRISIYGNSKEAPEQFTELYAFEYSDFALSFTYDGENCFYIGTGFRGNLSSGNKNGMILKVDITK